jgi:hypothetical protein
VEVDGLEVVLDVAGLQMVHSLNDLQDAVEVVILEILMVRQEAED